MVMKTAKLISVFGLMMLFSGTAAAQRPRLPRWGLKVASVDAVPDTRSQAFRAEVQLTNNDFGPRDASEVQVRTFFDEPGFDIELVNATWASVTTFDGAQTGIFGAVEFSGFGRLGLCRAIPGRITNGNVFNFTTSSILVPPGGHVTFIVTLQRAGGLFPFNVNGDNFSALDGDTALHEDPFFALFFSQAPGANTPACVWEAPLIPAIQPLNPCTGEPFPCNTSF
jgi:hypothetical protein